MNKKHQYSKEHYLEDMARLSARPAPRMLTQFRTSGAVAVREMEYPHVGMEAWRQTNVGPLVKTPFTSLIDEPASAPGAEVVEQLLPPVDMPLRYVFVDGFFRADLSRPHTGDSVFIEGIGHALRGPQSSRVLSLLQDGPEPHHIFEALNKAFTQDGLFCHVAANTVLETPIHVVFVTSERLENTAAHIRNLVLLEPGAQASLVYHFVAVPGGNPYFNTCAEDIRLGENACLKRTELVSEGNQGYRMSVCNVRQEQDSRLESYAFTLDGGAITRNEIHVDVLGSGAESQLHGLYLNQASSLVDNDLHINHREPHCASRMRYKGILGGRSHSVFTGKIYVAQKAQKTDSKQLCANLVLSEQARVDAKPQLEIYADDVRCTHGVTVGGPPESELFYLRSRGIDEQFARKMLTNGFAGDVVERLPDRAIRAWLKRSLSARLQRW